MEKYVLTNVRFPQEVHDRLKYLALEEGESVAGIVREAVSTYLAKRDGKTLQRDELENDPFFQVLGIGASGNENSSAEHDAFYHSRPNDTGEPPETGRPMSSKRGSEQRKSDTE